ncbi:MAG TPA: c-type cytochrome biogenesis protein CcsB, partial [Bacteroidales bacterium]|nr:c-type cytochrome biogenesis protein CcsB [Bacteroidales bacterium]
LDQGSFFLKSAQQLRSTKMTDREVTIYDADSLVPLMPMIVYTAGDYKIVPQKLTLSGLASIVPAEHGTEKRGPGALEFRLSGSGYEETVYLWDDPAEEIAEWAGIAGNVLARVTYGSRKESLPFVIRLNDFILERYPGSNSPSGYKSNVTLIDKEQGVEFPYDIYMNHILKHRGYRFYQSSFDPDEKGTVLSVNHDPAGMLTTYAGYALLFLFIVLSIINRKSFFRTVSRNYWSSRYRRPLTIMFLLVAMSFGSQVSAQELILDRKEADNFGAVLAQDQKGRTKPLYTISNDILRKVTKENDFNGLSSMQVFLGYSLDFMHWQNVPLIKVSNADLQKVLGLKTDRAAFTDIVDFGPEGGYRLSSYVDKAYAKPESERSRFDKEAIKLDERVNICYMMSRGDFLRLYPLKDSTDHWGSSVEAARIATNAEDSIFIMNVLPLWAQSVTAIGKVEVTPEESRTALINYQRAHASYELPSVSKVKAELFYYKAKIFEKLFPGYSTLGLIMIITLLAGIIAGKKGASLFMKILVGIAVMAFAFHTLGLSIRWYISGHSPMSNGYESMLFISWVTMLAGFIFSRKSMLALAATSVLAGMTLMVAHLSFMDPEITNLVPVLKSYWLTLHVSVITGSYGFLGLGAILGLIVLVMMMFVNDKNQAGISTTIDELTVINYKSITLGLYFLTIGTFLGAVWANESWGRYWGWDPKETWSLITIVIYTLVTHSRIIPGMKDTYMFNLLSLFAFSSVLMTYFGVNYYLSGLHSYAQGDPVPVPVFVYVAVVTLTGFAAAAYFRYKSSGKSGH